MIRTPGPRAVVGVSLASLAAGTFATVGIGALAPELETQFDFSRGEIGLLTALMSIGAAVASRRSGALTDSAGPVKVLAASLVLFAAAILLGALAPAAAVFMAATFVAGLGYGGINPPTNVVVAGSMRGRLGFFMSVKQTGVPIGGFLAGIVLPPLAVWLSWRVAFGLTAFTALVVACSTLLLRGAAVLRSAGEAGGEGGPSRRERLAIGLYGFVMAGSQWVFLTYFVLYLTDSRGFSLERAGLALSVATAFSVGGRLFWGWVSDRPGWRVSALVGASGVALVMLALLAGGVGGAGIWPLAGATGAALVGWNGAFHALVAERAGPAALGRLSGEVMAVVFAGSVCLPPLLGYVSQALDSWVFLWASAGIVVAAASLVLWGGLRSAARAQSAPGGGQQRQI